MRFKSKIYRRFEFQHDFLRFLLIDRVMMEKDNIVLVTGKRGDGKTTMALKMIIGFRDMERMEKVYNETLNKGQEEEKPYVKLKKFTKFNMKEHLVFTQKQLNDLCRNLRNGFILSDEAVVNVARRNSMTKANKILHQVITINRKNFNTLFFCMPTIEDFDISILQYVTHWVHIDDRGLAVVLFPNPKSIFGRKTWDIDMMKKMYDKFLMDNPTAGSIPYWLFENFRGYIRFKPLAKGTEEKYLSIAYLKKNEQSEIDEIKEEKTPRFAISDDKKKILEKISSDLMKGTITDPAEYYSYCSTLEFTKEKFNKEINKILVSLGEGRNATRIIKENKNKDDASYEKQVQERKIIF